jgi:Tfp pilus assembly protein PilO
MSKNHSPQIFFVLAALTLAAGTGATIFQWQEIGDKWDTIAELKKSVRDPKDIQAEFDETSAKVVSSKAELVHLERGVPAFAYVPTMLRELEAYGKQNGIEVLGIRPIPKAEQKDKDGKKKKAPYEEISIEVKGRGGYNAVKSFVSALQKFPKIVSARAVSLQPKEMPGLPAGSKSLDVTLELRAFLFAPSESPEDQKSATRIDPGASTNSGAAEQPAKPAEDKAKAAATAPASPSGKAEVNVQAKKVASAPAKKLVASRTAQFKGARKPTAQRKFIRRKSRR